MKRDKRQAKSTQAYMFFVCFFVDFKWFDTLLQGIGDRTFACGHPFPSKRQRFEASQKFKG